MRVLFMLPLLLAACAQEQQFTTRQESIPASKIKQVPAMDVTPPILHSDEFEEPIPLPAPVSTAGAEDSPFIAPDGQLYFFFTPDAAVPAEQQLFDGVTGIYVARKSGDSWTEPQRVVLQKHGKLALDGCLFTDDKELWICSAREGYTGINWFISTTKDITNGAWEVPNYAGDWFAQNEVGELHLWNDELYFHSARPGGKGQLDIWMSTRSGDGWSDPVNLADLNTAETEGWPYLTPDGKEIWFLRTHKGMPALFRSKRGADDAWLEPEMIVEQFAGEPTLDAEGNLYFVHHYFKDNKMLEADLYVAKRKR